jgi:flagellin
LFADSEVSSLDTPSYIGGIYTQASGTSLQDLIDEINTGTQSRIQVNLGPTGSSGLVSNLGLTSGQTMNVCFSGTDSNGQTINEVIQFYHTTSAAAPADATGITYVEVSANAALEAAEVLANAMSASTNFQTMYDNSANTVMVFYNEAGDYNDFTACDIGSATGTANVTWTTPNTTQSWTTDNDRANFGLGGENWVKAIAVKDGDKYFMNLTGRDVGENHDVEIFGVSGYTVLNGFGTTDFEEIVDAADGRWDGAHIRTQSHAQESLAALDAAILRKDVIRANLGAYQNRLENTMTNLEIQAEALQASESRISDVDVAVEMTEFTRNNVLAQAAVSMLAQANSLGQLALSLLQ